MHNMKIRVLNSARVKAVVIIISTTVKSNFDIVSV